MLEEAHAHQVGCNDEWMIIEPSNSEEYRLIAASPIVEEQEEESMQRSVLPNFGQ